MLFKFLTFVVFGFGNILELLKGFFKEIYVWVYLDCLIRIFKFLDLGSWNFLKWNLYIC